MRFRALSLFAVTLLMLPASALAGPGSFDPTFGSGGTVTTIIGDGDSGAADVAIQADGGIVTVGSATAGGAGQVSLVRFDTTGTLDPSFGNGGIVLTPVGDGAAGTAVAVQADQKIVVGGRATIAGVPRFLLLRYDASGTLDPGFGVGGIATLTLGSDAGVNALAIQSDQKIVAVGTRTAADTSVALARFDTAGVLDASFGTGGVTTTLVGAWSRGSDVALLPGNALAVAGTSEDRFLAARYDANGTLDPTFGSGGVVTTVVTPASDSLNAIAAQNDGALLVTGLTGLAGVRAFTTARYTHAGALDPAFGTGGIVFENFGLYGEATDLQVLPDGKIVVAGTAINPSGPPAQTASYFVMVRYDAAGVRDDAFAFAGDGPSPESFLSAIALQTDGRIVAAGSGGFSFLTLSYFDHLVGRYDASTCGNGFTEGVEECDDGDAQNGDGCDANCTVTACGNGIVTAGEDCDGGDCCAADCTFAASGTACTADANECTDDRCDAAGACTHPPNTLPCDDFSVCTVDDVCSGGTCRGTSVVSCPTCLSCDAYSGECVVAPRTDCRGSVAFAKSLLHLTTSTDPKKQALQWKYRYGAATTVAELGDPTATTDFDACLFHHPYASPWTLEWSAAIPAGGSCKGKPCWKPKGSGFMYRDPTHGPDGIERLALRAGVAGKAAIDLKAKGTTLAAPNPPPSSSLTPLVLQLQRRDGGCWQSTLQDSRTSGNANIQKRKLTGQ
jgi:uncharacterized delta-60 repeat protein